MQLRLSALNSTKTGFASFAFEKNEFFEAYSFQSENEARSGSGALDRFFCQIYVKVSRLVGAQLMQPLLFTQLELWLIPNLGPSVHFPWENR